MRRLAFAAGLALLGCATVPDMGGPFIATDRFRAFQPLDAPRVEGSACRWWALVSWFGDASVASAYADAMRKAPAGATGLADASISVQRPLPIPFALLLSRSCTRIEGVPARRDTPVRRRAPFREGGGRSPAPGAPDITQIDRFR